MSNEIDDDILSVQSPDQDDDILEVSPPPSIFSSIKPALETAQDFSIGTAKGLTAGAMDEIGGFLSAGLETGLSYVPGTSAYETRKIDEQLKAQGFEVPEESFLQKYRGYQQASEQAQREAAERSPVADVGGQIAGGLTGGALLGPALGLGTGGAKLKSISDIARDSGKAKAALELLTRGATSYAKATPLMAAEAALTSEKQLLGPESDISGVMSDVGSNLAFGLPAVLGLEATSELAGPALKAAGEKLGAPIQSVEKKITTALQSENNPRLRQLYKAYKEYGQDLGIHPRSHAADIGPAGFAQRDQKAVGGVLDVLNSADEKLGKEVGDSLKKATQRGALIDISPDIQDASKRILDLSNQFPSLGQTRKSASSYDKILNGTSQLTPIELKNLIDDIDTSINIFKSSTNLNPQETATLGELFKFRSSISGSLKKNVPEYRDAAQRFEGFRNVLEQVVSGSKPADVTEKFYGNLRNQQDKLYTNILDMVENVQNTSESAQSSRTAFSNFMEALNKFEQSNPNKAKQLFDSQGLRKFILDASDDSVLRGSSRNVMQARGIMPDLKEAFIGKLPITGSYLAGKTVKKAAGLTQKPLVKGTVDLAKRIYNAPAQSLSNVASRLESTGEFQNLGRALRESIESGNTYKKNAALFTIMQNPNARVLIGEDDLQDQENATDKTREP
jgi:hypothetical protein